MRRGRLGCAVTLAVLVSAVGVGLGQPAAVARGASASPTPGYWLVGSDGGVFAFGSAPFLGSGADLPNAALVGTQYIGITPGLQGGYCIGTTEIGSNEFGGARCGQAKCNGPCPSVATAIRAAPGTGVASFSLRDGAITTPIQGAGDAENISSAPVVGFSYTPDGMGYWEVASDGGVFAFGDAGFFGSMGGRSLAAPVVGLAPTTDGKGYWLVASDGGVFAFGDAPFAGSMGGTHLNAPMVAVAANPEGTGYWTVAGDGGVFSFGDAPYEGGMGGKPLAAPIVGMAATP